MLATFISNNYWTWWDVFFLMFIWIPMLFVWGFAIFDVFTRRDLSGWGKAAWLLAIVSLKRAERMLGDLQALVDVLFPEPGKQEPLVDFGKPDLLNRVVGCYAGALKHKLTNPEFAFVSRTELGLVSLLHQLAARVNTREIWRRVHEQATGRH